MNKIIDLIVPDMHCDSCPKLIKMALLDINGVIEVSASLEAKTVNVNFDSNLTSTDEIIKAIKEIGYTASLKQI